MLIFYVSIFLLILILFISISILYFISLQILFPSRQFQGNIPSSKPSSGQSGQQTPSVYPKIPSPERWDCKERFFHEVSLWHRHSHPCFPALSMENPGIGSESPGSRHSLFHGCRGGADPIPWLFPPLYPKFPPRRLLRALLTSQNSSWERSFPWKKTSRKKEFPGKGRETGNGKGDLNGILGWNSQNSCGCPGIPGMF